MDQQVINDFVNSRCRFGYFIDAFFPGRREVTGAEIGVHLGIHSEIMLRSKSTLHLYGIDLWEKHAQQNTGYLNSPGTLPARFAKDQYGIECHKEAENRLRRFGGRSVLLCASSQEAAAGFSDQSLDFVYVDGDHSYGGCRNDIRNWLPKVRLGGIIAGHDWGWEGVRHAVLEFFPVGVRNNCADEKTGKCWFVDVGAGKI